MEAVIYHGASTKLNELEEPYLAATVSPIQA